VNFAGSETASVQEYTQIAGRLLGVPATCRESPTAYYPIWANVTRMHERLGPCRVGVAEGVQRVVDAAELRRGTIKIPG